MSEIKVWDPFVRFFHWTVVASFFIAYFTEDEVMWLHELAGYTILFLVIARIAWGFIGTRYARFSNFIYKPATIKQYLNDMRHFKSKRYIGHNPAGGIMVIVLMLMLLLTSWSGIQLEELEESAKSANTTTPNMISHRYVFNIQVIKSAAAHSEHKEEGAGHKFWEEVHELLANATLFLVFLHVAGVIFSGIVHGENLVRAMITGRKREED
ncbi:MAG: cytochrome b/b6 domain-containing protein [Gammaproteobacteria bacterium]|nr:cytochrome b/b6 domain-containing protein [Gammaproteobacteria bacterium]